MASVVCFPVVGLPCLDEKLFPKGIGDFNWRCLPLGNIVLWDGRDHFTINNQNALIRFSSPGLQGINIFKARRGEKGEGCLPNILHLHVPEQAFLLTARLYKSSRAGDMISVSTSHQTL